MKTFLYSLASLVAAFAGGFLALHFVGWLNPDVIIPVADATAVANTYIVFVTFIFVGFTVVLGVAGFVFTQQFTSHKLAQETEAINELKARCKREDGLAEDIFRSLLDVDAVKALFDTAVRIKVTECLKARMDDLEQTTHDTNRQINAVREGLHSVGSVGRSVGREDSGVTARAAAGLNSGASSPRTFHLRPDVAEELERRSREREASYRRSQSAPPAKE